MIKAEGTKAAVFFTILVAGAGTGCRKVADDETAQVGAAVGELMSSFDEASAAGGELALFPSRPFEAVPEDLRGPLWRRALAAVVPTAEAAACVDSRFSACSAGTRTRTFSDCNVGAAKLDGTVSLTFSSRPLCAMAAPGDAVTRTANFTLTGLYGGTLTVTSPGGGQTLTRTATGFDYAVSGMERVLKGPAGRTLFDVTTETTAPFKVTGSSRADFVVASGALKITHHLAGYAVTLTASNLAWSAHCTCAVSGSLSGTVAGGRHDGKSATLTLNGCGDADLTIGQDTQAVTLDRCSAI